MDTIDRFNSKINKTETCWIWLATKDKNGYGEFYFNKKLGYAHRFSYEYFIGKIPAGLTIDHLCLNKSCVNPKHLETVSLLENNRRSLNTIAGKNMRKTHCPLGHLYDEKNTYVHPRDGRRCRKCRNERW